MQTNRYLVTVQRADPTLDADGQPIAPPAVGAPAPDAHAVDPHVTDPQATDPQAADPRSVEMIRFERALENQLSACPVLRRCLPVQVDLVDNQAPQSATFLVRFAGECEKTILAFVVDGAVSQQPLQGAVKPIP